MAELINVCAKKCLNWCRLSYSRRFCRAVAKRYVLGIESSCDETGAAVVDENGIILGEGLSSQLKVHLEFGGVIPHIATYLHRENIDNVVKLAIEESKLNFQDISAFAATAKPGFKSSLNVGLEYGKQLAKKWGKPFIPVHHMEAHSLTARMVETVDYPFLVFLASGGHCQLAVVNSVNDFLLLGNAVHNSPGEVLDKIARRLKLSNLPECENMSGGHAIEHMSIGGDPLSFEVPTSMTSYRNCDFSFAGYNAFASKTIDREEKIHDIAADGIIPSVRDFCASIQHAFAFHFIHRIQRALEFCKLKNLLPLNPTLVFSGGVACNQYIRNVLKLHCESQNCQFVCPPPKLCTDNGIMIAWNAMEKLKADVDVYWDFDHIVPEPNAPLGTDFRKAVQEASIKVKLPKVPVITTDKPCLSELVN